jgi:hypothetical protein
MSLPPLSISVRTTALAFCRVAASAVSKTSAVPRPTGGRGSPVEGIERVNRDEAGCAKAGKVKLAAPAANAAAGKFTNWRRVNLTIHCPDVAEAPITLARCSWERPNAADKISQIAETGAATSAIVPSFSPRSCKLSNTQP